jgi:hypothetical protein
VAQYALLPDSTATLFVAAVLPALSTAGTHIKARLAVPESATRRALLGGTEDQQEAALVSTSRPAGPASAVDRPVGASRWQSSRHRTGRGFAIDRGLLARMLRLEVGAAVFIIVAGILLVVLKANPSNSIVSDIHGWARSLAHPFAGMLSFRDARVAVAVNWGIAAVAYSLMGALIGRLTGGIRR